MPRISSDEAEVEDDEGSINSEPQSESSSSDESIPNVLTNKVEDYEGSINSEPQSESSSSDESIPNVLTNKVEDDEGSINIEPQSERSSSDESILNVRTNVTFAPVAEPVYRQESFTASSSRSASTRPVANGSAKDPAPATDTPPAPGILKNIDILTMDHVKQAVQYVERLTARTKSLLEEQPKRELVIKQFWRTQGINITRPSNMEAALVNLTGDPAPQPCDRCRHGCGPFVGCFVSRITGKSWCGNCSWHNYALKCSHIPSDEREKLRRKRGHDKPESRRAKRARQQLEQGTSGTYRGIAGYQPPALSFTANYAAPGPAAVHPVFAQQQQQQQLQQQPPPPPQRTASAYATTPAAVSAGSITIPLPAGTTPQEKRRLAIIFDSLAAALENAANEEEDGFA